MDKRRERKKMRVGVERNEEKGGKTLSRQMEQKILRTSEWKALWANRRPSAGDSALRGWMCVVLNVCRLSENGCNDELLRARRIMKKNGSAKDNYNRAKHRTLSSFISYSNQARAQLLVISKPKVMHMTSLLSV